MSSILDIERSLSRLMLGRGSPKDINLLKVGPGKTLELSELLCNIESNSENTQHTVNHSICITVKSDEGELNTIHKNLDNHQDLFKLLSSAVLDNNLSSTRKGGFIDPKYNQELSELSYVLNNSNKLITKLCESYCDLTDIAALKILHNNIFGYYIEVSANHKLTSNIFIHR